jgi:hypothetical protein
MPQNLSIVIVDDSGQYYRVPTEEWMTPENKIQPQFAGDARVLVKRGALTAEVPKPSYPSGYYCELINFSEVTGAGTAPVQSSDGSNRTSAEIGTEGLIIHIPQEGDAEGSEGAYYVVSQTDWQQLVIQPKDVPKLVPKSAALADAGALCGFTDEGFLLNLNLIGTQDG